MSGDKKSRGDPSGGRPPEVENQSSRREADRTLPSLDIMVLSTGPPAGGVFRCNAGRCLNSKALGTSNQVTHMDKKSLHKEDPNLPSGQVACVPLSIKVVTLPAIKAAALTPITRQLFNIAKPKSAISPQRRCSKCEYPHCNTIEFNINFASS